MATPIPHNSARFTVDELAIAAGGRVRAASSRPLIGVVTDSRAITPACIFVALRGETHDAHAFVQQAIAAGAGAVVVSRDVLVPDGVGVVMVDDTLRALGDIAAAHRRRFSIPVVAITGSVGKTTTKELTAAALDAIGYRTHRTPGNLNNLVGLPLTLLGIETTDQAAVVEMGMNVRGEIARLTEIAAPTVGVVTAVSEVHTQGVGSIAGVAREKGALLLGLDAEASAVWTSDDGILQPYGAQSPARRKITFGIDSAADVRLTEHRLESGRTRCAFAIRGVDGPVRADLALLGEGPARSACAALAAIVAIEGAQAAVRAAPGLGTVAPTPGRARPVSGPNQSTILDDSYNASPRATELALQTCAELAAGSNGRAVAVLGDMKELGTDSERLHEEVGAAAVTAGIQILVCCGPEMRAAARGAVSAMLASGATGMRIESVDDPVEAIALLREAIEQGDVVLVKGSRSMQMERIVDALRSDRAPEALR